MEKNQDKKIRKFIGIVVSDKADKTIAVKVDRRKLHPKYKKYYRVTTKYQVHDEKGLAKEGDKVVFVESRPMSKTKRWRLLEVLK